MCDQTLYYCIQTNIILVNITFHLFFCVHELLLWTLLLFIIMCITFILRTLLLFIIMCITFYYLWRLHFYYYYVQEQINVLIIKLYIICVRARIIISPQLTSSIISYTLHHQYQKWWHNKTLINYLQPCMMSQNISNQKNNTRLKMVSNNLPKINTHNISMHVNWKNSYQKYTYINTRI